jgi:hypothetical protein
VVTNQESLRLQYPLRQRARELGWREADINIIDADLGICGASAAQRTGVRQAGQRTRWWHSPDALSAPELAGASNIPVNWLYVQIRQGRLLADRHPGGAHVFRNAPSVIDAVRRLRNRTEKPNQGRLSLSRSPPANDACLLCPQACFANNWS